MKTIIVPLDFSNEALPGLNLAIMLAKKTGASIIMVYVINKIESINNELLEKEHKQAKMRFEEIITNYKKKSKLNFGLTYEIKEGKVFKEITDIGDKYDDSMIVLSTHGQSGFEELFIGGNAYKIISHSKIPVITVRRTAISSNINKIVLPLDMTFQTREKVPFTVKLAKLFNSEIHIVTVRLSNIKSIERKLLQYAKQVAHYLHTHEISYKMEHLKGDNLTDLTLDYSRMINSDLISIMTEQEKSVSNLLLGNYAHQMINKAYVPVLSFPTYQITLNQDGFRTEGISY